MSEPELPKGRQINKGGDDMLTLAMMLGDWLRDVVEPVDAGKNGLQQRLEA